MSLSLPTVKSLGQLAVEGETLIAIDLSSKTQAGRYASAQVALQVAAAFTAAGSGDVSGALATAVAAILAKVTDPGQVALVNSIANVGMLFLTMAAQANGAFPLLNATWQGVATEVAAGITTIAGAYKAASAT